MCATKKRVKEAQVLVGVEAGVAIEAHIITDIDEKMIGEGAEVGAERGAAAGVAVGAGVAVIGFEATDIKEVEAEVEVKVETDIEGETESKTMIVILVTTRVLELE